VITRARLRYKSERVTRSKKQEDPLNELEVCGKVSSEVSRRIKFCSVEDGKEPQSPQRRRWCWAVLKRGNSGNTVREGVRDVRDFAHGARTRERNSKEDGGKALLGEATQEGSGQGRGKTVTITE